MYLLVIIFQCRNKSKPSSWWL